MGLAGHKVVYGNLGMAGHRDEIGHGAGHAAESSGKNGAENGTGDGTRHGTMSMVLAGV